MLGTERVRFPPSNLGPQRHTTLGASIGSHMTPRINLQRVRTFREGRHGTRRRARTEDIGEDHQWGQPLTFVVRSSESFQIGEAQYLKNLQVG